MLDHSSLRTATVDRLPRDPSTVLIGRLSHYVQFDGAALSTLRDLPWHLADFGTSRSTRAFDGLRDRVLVVLSGVIFQQAIVRSGARQVLGVYLAGEVAGLECTVGSTLPTLGAHGPVEVAVLDASAWRAAIAEHPAIRTAVDCELSASLSVTRAWLTNNCRREAAPRVAHLLCEIAHRSGDGGLPRLTQEFLSDCVGLTSVHTNRVLRRLEAMGCVRRDGDRYHLADARQLREFGEFDPAYLPVPGRQRRPIAA